MTQTSTCCSDWSVCTVQAGAVSHPTKSIFVPLPSCPSDLFNSSMAAAAAAAIRAQELRGRDGGGAVNVKHLHQRRLAIVLEAERPFPSLHSLPTGSQHRLASLTLQPPVRVSVALCWLDIHFRRHQLFRCSFTFIQFLTECFMSICAYIDNQVKGLDTRYLGCSPHCKK